MGEVPLAGELEQRQPVAVGDRAHALELLAPALHPAGRPEAAMVRAREGMAGEHVVVEQPAVVDDARDQPDAVLLRGGEHELARPRLERVEDDHRPVDQLAVALEAVEQVEREAVGRAGRDAEPPREAGLPQRRHALPDGAARVAGAVGVVQQEQVERVRADPLQRALRRHPQVARVAVGAAQPRIREARVALRSLPLAFVEVVPDGADQAVGVAVRALQRPAEQRVGVAGAVGVRGHDRAHARVRAQQREQPLVVERDAEVHEAAAAPGSDGGPGGLGHRRRW